MLGWERALCLAVVVCGVVWGEEEMPHGGGDQHGPHHGAAHHGPGVSHQGPGGEHNDDYDHQAILGSKDADEEFEKLAPEVASMRLQELVKQHDLNSDGVISKKELEKWITNSFQKLDHDEAVQKFEEEDDDGDGKVTWDEYLEKAHSFSHKDVENMRITRTRDGDKTEQGRSAGSDLKMIDDDEIFFKGADLDHDSSLSRQEYLAFYFPPNFPHMHTLEMERYMRETDHDKDGRISKEEFSPGQSEDADTRASAEENFAEYDKDKDGFLSVDEAKLWVVPSNDEQISTEVTHLLGMADTNGDGKLGMKEILAKTHEFVGSSITDYGNFLQDNERDEL